MSDQNQSEKEEKKRKRVERFTYSAEDIKHIFRLGDIGNVFDENKISLKLENILKKMKKSNQKMMK